MKINEKTKGKGLSLILGDELDYKAKELQQSGNSITIDISKLVANPFIGIEPDEKEVDKLANAIKENGQLTPILVRKKDEYYEVIIGEKRYYACKKIGMKEIKVVICDFSDNEVQELYMYDLLYKDKLNIVAEAKLYQAIIKNKKINQTELADKLDRSRSSVSNTLRLLNLDKKVLRLIVKYRLTLGQVKPLIGLDSDFIIELMHRIKLEKLSSRDIERIAKAEKQKQRSMILANEKEKNLNKKYNCNSRIRGKKVELTFKNNKEAESFIKTLLDL